MKLKQVSNKPAGPRATLRMACSSVSAVTDGQRLLRDRCSPGYQPALYQERSHKYPFSFGVEGDVPEASLPESWNTEG